MHGLANMLAIAATLLFGILVVYALVMMVVPQVISSVTSLYYTAQTSIARFMRWVNTQDVFLDNATLMGYFNDASIPSRAIWPLCAPPCCLPSRTCRAS